jgi:serine/threonine protein kinase
MMHLLKIVHTDIKPDNIMFSKAFNKLVFIDFGLSDIIKQKMG